MSRRKRDEQDGTSAGAHPDDPRAGAHPDDPRAGTRHGLARDEPVSLTAVPEPASEEMDRRWHVYVIQMVVRIGCFVGALFTHGPLQIVLIVGAVVLPYTAVIFANAGGERRSSSISTVELPAITSGPEARDPIIIEQVDIVEQSDVQAQDPVDTNDPRAGEARDDASDAQGPSGGATGPAAGGTRSAA